MQATQRKAHFSFGQEQFIGGLMSWQYGDCGARSWRGWGVESDGERSFASPAFRNRQSREIMNAAANSRAVALWGR
jgi:hypothetical protein